MFRLFLLMIILCFVGCAQVGQVRRPSSFSPSLIIELAKIYDQLQCSEKQIEQILNLRPIELGALELTRLELEELVQLSFETRLKLNCREYKERLSLAISELEEYFLELIYPMAEMKDFETLRGGGITLLINPKFKSTFHGVMVGDRVYVQTSKESLSFVVQQRPQTDEIFLLSSQQEKIDFEVFLEQSYGRIFVQRMNELSGHWELVALQRHPALIFQLRQREVALRKFEQWKRSRELKTGLSVRLHFQHDLAVDKMVSFLTQKQFESTHPLTSQEMSELLERSSFFEQWFK